MVLLDLLYSATDERDTGRLVHPPTVYGTVGGGYFFRMPGGFHVPGWEIHPLPPQDRHVETTVEVPVLPSDMRTP